MRALISDRRKRRELVDLAKAGFWVHEEVTGMGDIPSCPYCGGSLYSQASWYCELTLAIVSADADPGCKCNWCLLNRSAVPGKGRPRKHCVSPECAKAHKREKNKDAYIARREALAYVA